MIVLSLGAGVQSSTMALMAARGELTPMPDCAIFADTQAEPDVVYRWLDWLEEQLPYPVHRVTRGSLGELSTMRRLSKNGTIYAKYTIPAFVSDGDGRAGIMMRQCTADFKIEVIQREIRRLMLARSTERRVLGRGVKAFKIEPVEQWIGITVDEAHRMKPSRLPYITNRWPLVFEKRMTRHSCLEWMRARGYPEPPRSACVFCPYHSNAEWARLKAEEPEEFARAVAFEEKYAETYRGVKNFRGRPFLHRSLVPLAQADFSEPDRGASLFGNECEGMCGV